MSYKIAANKNNEGYMATEYFEDIKTIESYKKKLQSKDLITPEKLQEHKNKIRVAETKLKNFEERADILNREMESYSYFKNYVESIGYEYEKERENARDEKKKDTTKEIL